MSYNHLLPAPNNQYDLHVLDEKLHWNITMTVLAPFINTKAFPSTKTLLTKYIPSILHCDCFNDAHKPFDQELMQTEIGHLFEHILLEYLCLEKLENGHSSAEFSGRTSWNWEKEPRGSFHIVITKEEKDSLYFPEAYSKSIQLLNLILHSNVQTSVN